jgi:type IV pilus assembly protein PilY1
MNIRFVSVILGSMLWAAVQPAGAEDTDLFVRASDSALPPDVLFVIDNAANFSANSTENCVIEGTATHLSGKVGGIEQCALYETIKALDDDSVNIGIMVYQANNVRDWQGVECVTIVSSKPGGCLVYPMQLLTAANKAELLEWIRAWKVSGNGYGYISANSEATGGSMQEAWAYYNGRVGLSGRDYADSRAPTTCSKYIIFIGNSFNSSGSPGDQTGNAGPLSALSGTNSTARMNAYPPATTAQRTAMMPTTTTSCANPTVTLGNPHENNGYYMDEWARYMYAHGIATYTIGLVSASCQAGYVALLDNAAKVGGGKYFETKNTQQLKDALGAALGAMLARNSVFASVSLPVSVSTQGYYLNRVYIGMFRPDRQALPRWFGNLKQYRLGRPAGGTSGIELQDAREPAQAAISIAHTGFLSNCALSYWTPTANDDYWEAYTSPTCGTYPGQSNTPDGDVVEKGGQAYALRGSRQATGVIRNLKTCNSGCTAIATFDADNAAISKTLLGDATMSDPTRETLIDWARGVHNKKEQDNVASTAVRPSVHGDVIHSRPVAINYGDNADGDNNPANDVPEVVVFYGANDGTLRAVNGERTTAIGSTRAGGELWSFMAPEFFPHFDRLRRNSSSIAYMGNPVTSPAPLPKPYGFDGPVTSHVVTGSGGHKWIFASMRRGGRALYAFDVTTLNTNTSSPTLKWKKGCDASGCTSGWDGIGQTWSAPSLFPGKDNDGAAATLLVMGGGYGGQCEDNDPADCTAADKGGRIYVVDADDGTKLREFDLSLSPLNNGGRGVVADVVVVTYNTGTVRYAKWIYAIDLGGNVYRISGATANAPIGATEPEDWTITKIASLGCNSDVSSCTYKRKFMMAPDIVETPDGTGVYYLLFGSGDREKPLGEKTSTPGDPYWPSAFNTTNYFFAIKDAPTNACWNPASETTSGTCTGHEPLTLGSLAEIDEASADEVAVAKGWYLPLNDHEQVVTTAITVYGITTFSTHTPEVPVENSCTSGVGTARVYNVKYSDASPKPGQTDRSAIVDGGGLPASPVAGMVTLDGESTPVPFLIGGDPESPLEGGEPTSPSTTTLPKSLTYWYIRK